MILYYILNIKMNSLVSLKQELLNLELVSSLDFVALQNKIKNEQYILSVNTFLSRLSKIFGNNKIVDKKVTKIFLSSYLLMNYREVVTSNDTYAIKLGNYATDLLMNLETLFTKEKVTLKEYNNYITSFTRYIQFFKIWQERDSLLMARPAINSWLNHDIMIENMKKNIKDDKNLTEEQKLIIKSRIQDLRRVQSKLRQNIKIISGMKGLEFLDNKEMPYFKDEEIFQSVEKTVRRAFWDVVAQNLKDEKYDQMIILLTDIKEIILDLAPTKKQELDNVLDKELLTQMIENGLLNNKAIDQYINYIIKHIETLQQPSEDTNTRTWKENITYMINKEEPRYKVLVYFFENAFNKLEKIKYLTLKIREQLKLSK
jgi:hypothetical protein